LNFCRITARIFADANTDYKVRPETWEFLKETKLCDAVFIDSQF